MDLPKISSNLKRDFPELTQEDWQRSHLLLEELDARIGGHSADIKFAKVSRSTRILHWLGGKTAEILLSHPRSPSIRELKRKSNGKDVLTTVNLNANVTAQRNPYSPSDKILSLSEILGHELKHNADHLFDLRHHDNVPTKKMQKLSCSYLMHASTFIGGLAGMGSGGMEFLYLINGWNSQLAEVSVASFVGGLALSAASLYNVIRRRSLSPEKFGIPPNVPFYAAGENPTCAYQIATEKNWENSIMIDQLVDENDFVENDWFTES